MMIIVGGHCSLGIAVLVLFLLTGGGCYCPVTV